MSNPFEKPTEFKYDENTEKLYLNGEYTLEELEKIIEEVGGPSNEELCEKGELHFFCPDYCEDECMKKLNVCFVQITGIYVIVRLKGIN